MGTRTRIVCGVVAIGLGLTACSAGAGSSPQQGGAQGKDTATVALRTPNWILPISAPGFTQGENEIFSTALYRKLFSYKLDGSNPDNVDPQRSLADPPVVSDEGKTLTITLKDNTWSDGKPITTKDIQFWWDLVTTNKDKWASYKPGGFPDNISAFKVKDDKTFSVTTTKAYNAAWFVGNQLNRIVPLPQHAWDKSGDPKQTFEELTAASKDPKSYATNPCGRPTAARGSWRATCPAARSSWPSRTPTRAQTSRS
ncbi:ABC transporter substrate-binding protein [Nonomuraea antimicrobica]